MGRRAVRAAQPKLDKELWNAWKVEGEWKEEQTETSRSVTASWVERSGRHVSLSSSTTWERDQLRVLLAIREEIRYPDGRVTVMNRTSEIRFMDGPSIDQSTATEVSSAVLTGDWRWRDFLPGSKGIRRAMHRQGFLRTIARYGESTEEET